MKNLHESIRWKAFRLKIANRKTNEIPILFPNIFERQFPI